MGKEVILKLNSYEARMLQACLGNQVLLEKKNGTQSEYYYFALETISKIEEIFRLKHASRIISK